MSLSRILSALVLIGVVGGTIFLLPPWATVVLAALAAAGAGTELAHLARVIGVPAPSMFVGAASAAFAVALAAPEFWTGVGPELVVALVLSATIGAALVTLALVPPGPAVLGSLGVLLLAPVYVGLPLGAIASVRATHGAASLVWLIAVIAVSDSAQYYVGTLFGRHKLSPVVSPKKTVEGLLGGLVAAPIVGAALAPWGLALVTVPVAAGLAFVLALFGVGGDLFESLLKRSAGVKDSSSLIPGHGGVLDRVDAYLFAAPVFYVFLRYFV